GLPALITDSHATGTGQEVERVVVIVVMDRGSAARAELGELGAEQRGVPCADQVVADPEVLTEVGLAPDDVLWGDHVRQSGVTHLRILLSRVRTACGLVSGP